MVKICLVVHPLITDTQQTLICYHFCRFQKIALFHHHSRSLKRKSYVRKDEKCINYFTNFYALSWILNISTIKSKSILFQKYTFHWRVFSNCIEWFILTMHLLIIWVLDQYIFIWYIKFHHHSWNLKLMLF